NVPRSLKKLEEVLFGDGPDYDDWRAQFRRVYEKQKSLTTERAIGEARNFIFPPEMPIWNFGFVGREDELAHLNEILSRDDRTAITQVAAASGMGGVGKTALAVEYVRRFGSRYGGVWWCRSETRPGLLASLGNLLRHLEPQAPEEPDLATAARAALTSLANRNASWLLVYDNVPSPDEINDLMPHAGAKLLITSRFPFWSEWAECVAVDVLPLEKAIEFLNAKAKRSDVDGARELANVLDRLPLALDHAAALCLRTHLSFNDYAVQAAKLIAVRPPGSIYPSSVVATFDLAISEAARNLPPAEFLMAVLAQCAP